MRPIVIEPSSGWKKIDFRQLSAYREVLRMLIYRDLKARYTQTLLGVGWVVFQPLFTVLLFSLVFGRWVRLSSDGVPYSLFVFCGMSAWVFVSQAIQRASFSMQMDSRLITKVYFPRLLLPLASVLSTSTDLTILIAILAVLLKIYGVVLTWKFCLLPLCVIPLFLLSLGLGSLLTAFSVYYRDVIALLPLFLQTWMYISPIVYSSSVVPEKWQFLYHLNPMAGVVSAMRWSCLGLSDFPLLSLSIAYLMSTVGCIFGILIFLRLERNFADVL